MRNSVSRVETKPCATFDRLTAVETEPASTSNIFVGSSCDVH